MKMNGEIMKSSNAGWLISSSAEYHPLKITFPWHLCCARARILQQPTNFVILLVL
jgi:hypothetical protein